MNYNTIINFDQKTVETLNRDNYSLCAYLACESLVYKGGSVLCWNVIKKDFLNSLKISWNEKYCAYISTSDICDGCNIYIPQPLDLPEKNDLTRSTTGSNYKIKLKQRMIVEEFNNIKIENEDINTSINISNETSTAFSSGTGVISDDQIYTGICSFNLTEISPIDIRPINKIFLTIIPNDFINENMVVVETSQIGILIDLQNATNQERTVSYSINNGWSPNDQTWLKHFDTNTNLAKILITEPQTLSASYLSEK
jgi:hypothetical protein